MASSARAQELWRDFFRSLHWSFGAAFLFSLAGVGRGAPIWVTTCSFGILMPLAAVVARMFLAAVRFRSFLLTVVVHSAAMFLFFGGAFLLSISLTIVSAQKGGLFSSESWALVGEIIQHPGVRGPMLGSVGLAFIITAISKISNKLGPGVLRNWLTGKYHEPREETRVFMFLDLRDSTTLAEKLGNLKFSALVRDFFSDMSQVCFPTKAEVSHYIGDEAVISWRPDRAKLNTNVLRFVVLFQEKLAENRRAYEEKYGHVPEFKVGAHMGSVVATEVGESKSEIVFHGDVMNTTARIQQLSSSLGHDFLISAELATFLELDPTLYATTDFGLQSLKGKEVPIQVFGINPTKSVKD